MNPVRMLVVWCPDWPVVAASTGASVPAQEPAAVFAANRVVACSATARRHGVGRGTRRREAQARCPELVVFDDDPARDARLFEPVAAAVEELAPGVEVVRPGLVAVPARGPVGYFGGEAEAAERLIDGVAVRTGVECQVGIADGLYAATLAAHRSAVVPAGRNAEFLAPLSIAELDQPAERRGDDRAELVDLLRRLGIRTLGAFAELPARDVTSRFGADAVAVHRLCRGLDERPPGRRRPPPDLAVTETFDPPVERVDAAAFAARALAESLHRTLARYGWACSRLTIVARTENEEELTRTWRCAEPLTSSGIADRVRWQLDGWLTGQSTGRPTAGIDVLRIEPDEVIAADALQLDLLNDSAETAELAGRAGRAMVHVQGLLGPDAVLIGVLGGGRGCREQVRLVPWGDEQIPALDGVPPWPGRLPAPSPSTVPDSPWPATVLDHAGHAVAVTGRHTLTAEPAQVALGTGVPRQIVSWAGPWPVDERWWTDLLTGIRSTSRRVIRFQAVLDPADDSGELGVLLAAENESWWVEGVYS